MEDEDEGIFIDDEASTTSADEPNVHIDNGRTYLESNFGKSWTPVDAIRLEHTEQIQSHVESRIPPLPRGRYLDIGGRQLVWATATAMKYPASRIDVLDSVFPRHNLAPHNVYLTQGDLEKPWPFDDGAFDVVHIQCLQWIRDRALVATEAQRCLREGGTLIFVEMKYFHNDVPQWKIWRHYCKRAEAKSGTTFNGSIRKFIDSQMHVRLHRTQVQRTSLAPWLDVDGDFRLPFMQHTDMSSMEFSLLAGKMKGKIRRIRAYIEITLAIKR